MRTGRNADRGRRPNACDLRLEGSLAVEDLNPLVPGVGDVDVALGIDHNAVHRRELALCRSSRSPGLDELAVLVKLGDPGVAVSIGYVNVPGSDPRHVGGPLENVALITGAGKSAAPAAWTSAARCRRRK